jgi:type II restriction enzyme
MGDDDSWAPLGFEDIQAAFEGPTQRARVWTEGWVARSMFCPNCGAERITPFPANRKVADFECKPCGEEYELKAQRTRFGIKVMDGAYDAKLERLRANNNPNLLLMKYDRARMSVTDLLVVPKHFFVPEIILPCKPLSSSARRAGWRGSHILLEGVPASGKIALVRDGVHIPKPAVLKSWRDTLFLREERLARRGWLIEVMRCVEQIGRGEFALEDVYAYERGLGEIYPENNNVRPKIRQQLQVLRDHGWLVFEGRGRYRRAHWDSPASPAHEK